MTCTHVQNKLTRYLERMCEKKEVTSIARHIELCPACGQQLRDLQRVRFLLKKSQTTPVDPIFLADVQTSIREHTTHAHLLPGLRRRSWIHQGRRLPYVISMAAVLLLTAVSLVWNYMADTSRPVARAPQPDDMYFILQEHVLQADQGVFTNGALGSVMVPQSRKK